MGRKKKAETKSTEYEQLISIFDSIDEPVYVSDPNSYEILYANKALKDRFGEVIGKKCYEVLQGMDAPCSFCTNEHIFGENVGKTHIWEFQNKRDKRWYKCIDKAIHWHNGLMVRYEMAIDITDLKQVEETLRNSEEKYRDIYDNTPDGIYSLDSNGFIRDANPAFLRMLGCTRNDVVGKMISEFLTGDGLRTLHDTFPDLKEKGTLTNVALHLKRRDGLFLPVSQNALAVYDDKGNFLKSCNIVRDDSVKSELEEKLMHASQEWRATFDSMPYGLMLIDSDFHIMRVNRYVSDLSGIPINDLIGKRCHEIIHGTEKPIEEYREVKAIKNLQPKMFELYEQRLNRYLLISIVPLYKQDVSKQMYIHSIFDITDNKETEKKLIESQSAFFNMLKDLDFSYKELKEIYQGLIVSFVNALDAKSPWTKGHSVRVTSYAIAIAKELGLKDLDIEPLNTAALLHDIGKIGTYDEVLDKPGKLTDEEFALVKLHPGKGADILSPIRQFQPILPIIRHHHERLDGKGYPDGLKDGEIPLYSRIIHVADSYDAMTADRPYRKAPGREFAISELKKYGGLQFDPDAAEAFIRHLDRTPEEKEGEHAAT